jgi:hypothetical protein
MSQTNNLAQDEAINRLFTLEQRLIVLARTFRVSLRPSPTTLRAHLTTLSLSTLDGIYAALFSLLRSFEICAEEGTNPWDDRDFFQLSMQALGYSFPPDFLDYLEPDDIIEGYDLSGRQIFRNMRFMEVSSYSLTEVLSLHWQVLFDRSTQITDIIMAAIEKTMFVEQRVVVADIPKHFIRELRSSQPLVAEIQHRYFAPLFNGPNKPAGFLGVCKGHVLDAELNIRRDNLAFI